jgi:hypothetical protein
MPPLTANKFINSRMKKSCNLCRRQPSLSYFAIETSTMTDLLSKTSSALKSFRSQYLKYSRIEDGENGDRELQKESEPRDESNSHRNIICVALAISLIFNVVFLFLQYKSANLDRICSHYTVASGSSPTEL